MARNFALIAALGLVAPVLADEVPSNWVDLREAVEAILTNATASARVNLYMTPNRPIRDGFIQTIDTEKDPNPPAGAVGVYETADGNRKAWIFYRESPLDPKGLMLLVR